MLAALLHDKQRLLKLNKTLPLHRLLVILISSNAAYYVILPCLDILEYCLASNGIDGFDRAFEAEGGFVLLARTLGPIWRSDIQEIVFRMMLGPASQSHTALQQAQMLPTILSALDILLQAASDTDEGRPSHARTRSGTVTSVRSIALSPIVTGKSFRVEWLSLTDKDTTNGARDARLEEFLGQLTDCYRQSQSLRRAITAKRIEALLPGVADFAAVSGSNSKPETRRVQRSAVSQWLRALIELSKASSSVITQVSMIVPYQRNSLFR